MEDIPLGKEHTILWQPPPPPPSILTCPLVSSLFSSPLCLGSQERLSEYRVYHWQLKQTQPLLYSSGSYSIPSPCFEKNLEQESCHRCISWNRAPQLCVLIGHYFLEVSLPVAKRSFLEEDEDYVYMVIWRQIFRMCEGLFWLSKAHMTLKQQQQAIIFNLRIKQPWAYLSSGPLHC